MKTTHRHTFITALAAVAALLTTTAAALGAQETSECHIRSLSHGRNAERPHYMGMASINISPWVPIDNFSAIPALSFHTSHGVFFPRQGIYTGASAEAVISIIGVAAVSSHTRCFFPAASSGPAQGYAGAELGLGFDYTGWRDVFFNGAAELGVVFNFTKVSLDLGLRAQFIPPYAQNGFFLPVRIGLIF